MGLKPDPDLDDKSIVRIRQYKVENFTLVDKRLEHYAVSLNGSKILESGQELLLTLRKNLNSNRWLNLRNYAFLYNIHKIQFTLYQNANRISKSVN